MRDYCSLAAQISAAGCQQATKGIRERRRHPCLGAMRDFGASAAVLRYLISATGFRTAAEVISGTGRSRLAVGGGLIFLRRHGLVECESDTERNRRYLRYAARNGVVVRVMGGKS